MSTLFTIGYEGQSTKEFIAHLNFNRISVVVDVRELPLSRKKGFSKTALATLLSENNIDYLNLRGLGVKKPMRDQLKKSGDFLFFSRHYLKELEKHGDEVKVITDAISSGHTVALLCFERDPNSCHRSLLAQEIVTKDGNGLRVKHIVPAL